MKFYKIFPIILLTLLSCKTEEDKYPEMPLFEPNMDSDFIFEEVSDFNSYYEHTDKYVFYNTDKGLLITTKKTKEIIKEIVLEKKDFKNITKYGTLFTFNEKNQKAYKYTPPNYNQTEIETVTIEGLDYSSLIEKNKGYLEKNNLTDSELYDYLDKIRETHITDKYIKNLSCALIVYPAEQMILRYPDKDLYTSTTKYFFRGTFIKSKLKGIEECNHANSDLDDTDYFKTNNLKLLEFITTDYNFSGSNHYVIGVSSSNLYYYKFDMDGKQIKFKSPFSIESIANYKDKIIIESMNKFYKVSIKN